MKRIVMALAGSVLLLGGGRLSDAGFMGTVGASSDSGVLVGTSSLPFNDDLAAVNDVIGDGIDQPPPGGEAGWNETFTMDPLYPLPLLSGTDTLLETFEETSPGSGVAGSTFGTFAITDFNWYTNVDPGGGAATAVWTAPNGTMVTFYQIPASQDLLDYSLVAFQYTGMDGLDAGIKYYTAKADAAAAGFSVWMYMPGELNVAYVDANGDIDYSDGTVVFDPSRQALSHINLYGVPEPSSAILFLLGAGGAFGFARFVRRPKAV